MIKNHTKPIFYKLVGKEVIGVYDINEEDLISEKRLIDYTEVDNGGYVSTIFLPIDHGYGTNKSLFFETMVFFEDDYPCEEYCERYSTYDEAVEGHNRIAKMFGGSLKQQNISHIDDELFNI